MSVSDKTSLGVWSLNTFTIESRTCLYEIGFLGYSLRTLQTMDYIAEHLAVRGA